MFLPYPFYLIISSICLHTSVCFLFSVSIIIAYYRILRFYFGGFLAVCLKYTFLCFGAYFYFAAISSDPFC